MKKLVLVALVGAVVTGCEQPEDRCEVVEQPVGKYATQPLYDAPLLGDCIAIPRPAPTRLPVGTDGHDPASHESGSDPETETSGSASTSADADGASASADGPDGSAGVGADADGASASADGPGGSASVSAGRDGASVSFGG